MGSDLEAVLEEFGGACILGSLAALGWHSYSWLVYGEWPRLVLADVPASFGLEAADNIGNLSQQISGFYVDVPLWLVLMSCGFLLVIASDMIEIFRKKAGRSAPSSRQISV